MAEINKPDYQQIWSSGGAIVAPSSVKIQTGWTAEVPPFQWENWSQNRQDQAIAHVLQHGISVWDNVTEYQAGKSYVQGSDGLLYRARTTNTNVNPVTDTTFVSWTKALSGGLINIQTFTSTGTYTPTPGTASIIVEVLGAGGGGGSNASTPTAGFAAGGSGGNAGAYAKSRITSAFSGATITVGGGGAGGAATAGGSNGSAGGSSSFGALVTSQGGQGGVVGSARNAFPTGNPVATTPATSSGANIVNGVGGIGLGGILFNATNTTSGGGADSIFGAGGGAVSLGSGDTNAAGLSATGYGAGGGGATSINGFGARVGGNGAPGIVIVWEYAA